MKKNLKALVTVVCLALSLVMSVTYVSAAQIEDPTVEPMWDNTRSVYSTVAFIDDVGYAESLVVADEGATSIKTDLYIFRKVGSLWYYVTEMHITKYDRVAGMSCPFSPDKGATYRADFTFTITMNGHAEVITRSSYGTFE